MIDIVMLQLIGFFFFLNFSVTNYRNKLFCDEKDTTRAVMCLNTITITHSVY